jgi:hypothetical protein
LLQSLWIISPLRGVEYFDTNDPALSVIVHDDAFSDLLTAFDGTVREVEIDCVGSLIDSYAHGFVLGVFERIASYLHFFVIARLDRAIQ